VRYNGKSLNLRNDDWNIMKILRRLFVNDALVSEMRAILNSPKQAEKLTHVRMDVDSSRVYTYAYSYDKTTQWSSGKEW